MVIGDWTEYVRQILNHAGHGYECYCPIEIPEKKRDRLDQIDRKILGKYPMCEWDKDRRYRAKKAGMANFVYIRWNLSGILMHTPGKLVEIEDPDRFFSLRERPYVFQVGSWVSIKIGPARKGKKFTAYLTKQSYRSIKALLRENIEKRRFDEFRKYYERLEDLPAFSGIVAQVHELYRFCRGELSRVKAKKEARDLKRLSLACWKRR